MQGAGRVAMVEPGGTIATSELPLDPIDVFRPGDSDEVRSLRRRIHRASGAAASRATRTASKDARECLWHASEIAGAWTFGPAGKDQLEDVIRALTSMFLAANALERLEAAYGD